MKAADLRSKSADELKNELIELRKEQFSLRMQKATGQMAQTHQERQIRRDIARIKTVMNEQNSGADA